MKIKIFITVIATAFHIYAEKPNIVLFFADDLDADEVNCTSEMNNIWATHTGAKENGFWNKGATGNVLTPNIDTLTRDGMLFTRFYVNATVCSPSRYCLLTGRYATRGLELQNDFPVGTHATLEWRPEFCGQKVAYQRSFKNVVTELLSLVNGIMVKMTFQILI